MITKSGFTEYARRLILWTIPTCKAAHGWEGQPAASTPMLTPGQARLRVSIACLTSSRRCTSRRVRRPFAWASRAISAATTVLPAPVGRT